MLWFIAQLVLESFSQYGEKLEAVVGLIAIGVLLLVLNWFFHRVYWTEWIAAHRKRGKALTADRRSVSVAAGAATIVGLYLLGLYERLPRGVRDRPLPPGAAAQLRDRRSCSPASPWGWSRRSRVGALTFTLEQTPPLQADADRHRRPDALVLVVLVGNTLRTLQGVGWLSITPIDVEFPLWMGTWLGIFPTSETLVAQLAAFAFVIGSYYAAEWVPKAPPPPRGVASCAIASSLRRSGAGARQRPHRSGSASRSPAWHDPGCERARQSRRPTSSQHLFDTVVGTVTLRASDLGRQRDFYERAIGLEARDESGTSVALTDAEGRTLIRLDSSEARGAEPLTTPHTGLFHNAFRYPDRARSAPR